MNSNHAKTYTCPHYHLAFSFLLWWQGFLECVPLGSLYHCIQYEDKTKSNHMSVDYLIPDEKRKMLCLYVWCISWDQNVIFPAVTILQKNIFPTEQMYFHSVPIEMICWFWSTPGLESGREPLRWLPWFQAMPSLGMLNSKPLSWASFLPLTYSPDQWSSAHCPLSLHTWSIFFPNTVTECQCCNLFVIRTTIKIHLFFISSSTSSMEE